MQAVFLSGQAALSGGFEMRAGRLFLGGRAAFLGGLSLNRIFCSKDSLLPILRVSKVQIINHIKLNHRSPAIAVFYPSTRLRLMQADAGFLNHVQAGRLLTQAGPGRR
jgi:hypothetical protein